MPNYGAVSVHLILRVQKVSKIYSGSSADLCLRGGLVGPWPKALTFPTEFIRRFLKSRQTHAAILP